jgi:hypothetical protein
LGSLPVFVGLGISYDFRNKINIKWRIFILL